jgi:hypothetical protein
MHPDNIFITGNSGFQVFKNMAAASHPFFGLGVEQSGKRYYSFKKKQENIVKEDSQRIDYSGKGSG